MTNIPEGYKPVPAGCKKMPDDADLGALVFLDPETYIKDYGKPAGLAPTWAWADGSIAAYKPKQPPEPHKAKPSEKSLAEAALWSPYGVNQDRLMEAFAAHREAAERATIKKVAKWLREVMYPQDTGYSGWDATFIAYAIERGEWK